MHKSRPYTWVVVGILFLMLLLIGYLFLWTRVAAQLYVGQGRACGSVQHIPTHRDVSVQRPGTKKGGWVARLVNWVEGGDAKVS